MARDTRLRMRVVEDAVAALTGRVELAVTMRGTQVGPGFVAVREVVPSAGMPVHGVGCVCCAPVSAWARALTAAMHDRARGRLPFFDSVCAVVAVGDRASLIELMGSDRLLAGYFRADD